MDLNDLLSRPPVALPPRGFTQINPAQQSPQFLRRDLPSPFWLALTERHRVRAFLQSLAPHRESVTVPIQNLDPIAPPAREHKQVSGEGIQLQVLAHQGVQAVKALAHIARRQAKIHPYAGRQVDHARKTPRTVRNTAASTPAPMRNRSPVANTSSRAASVGGS